MKKGTVTQAEWNEFWSDVCDSYIAVTGHTYEMGRVLAEYCMRARIVGNDSTILDIGSGPGIFARPLAENGCAVTAIDPAAGMCGVLSREAANAGVSNISVVCREFRGFVPSAKYDLVLAAFCPVMREPDCVAMMEEMSGRYCAFVLSACPDASEFRKALWQKIFERPCDAELSAEVPLAMLLDRGRKAACVSLPYAVEICRPVEVFEHFYSRYFRLFGGAGKKVDAVIHAFFNDVACDGYIWMRYDKNLSLIWWEKNG